jgi:hypothetical protein
VDDGEDVNDMAVIIKKDGIGKSLEVHFTEVTDKGAEGIGISAGPGEGGFKFIKESMGQVAVDVRIPISGLF